MITILRRTVYFGTILLSLLGIILMLAQSDGTQAPSELKILMLSMVFVLGILLIIVIVKRGLGG